MLTVGKHPFKDHLAEATLAKDELCRDSLEVCLETVEAMTYQIRVQGWLDEARLAQFAAVSLYYVNKETVITAVLSDQSALYGFLNRLRDLGVTLISLQFVEEEKTAEGAEKSRKTLRSPHPPR